MHTHLSWFWGRVRWEGVTSLVSMAQEAPLGVSCDSNDEMASHKDTKMEREGGVPRRGMIKDKYPEVGMT